MSRLLYIDSFSDGAFHETFNATSLMMMSEIFDEVSYYSSNSSAKNTLSLLKHYPKNVKQINIPILSLNGSIGNFLHFFLSNIVNVVLLLIAKKGDVVFYNYHSIWADEILSLIVKYKHNKVIVMCHGELEYLGNAKSINPISSYFLKKIKSGSIKLSSNFYYCVLGDSILNNVCKSVKTHIAKKFLSFEHPLLASKDMKSSHNNGRLKIGSVGTIKNSKGFEDVCRLNNLLKDCGIDIYLLGRTFINQMELDNQGLKYIPGSQYGWIPKDILNEYIDSMDYLFFLYPTYMYKFTASGALLDSIDREKVILSLHNDYFDGIVEKMDIGYLFDDINQMSLFIKGRRGLGKIDKDFKSIKYYLSHHNQSFLFQKLLKEKEII